MKIRKPIRTSRSSTKLQKRVFDFVVRDDFVGIEIKSGKEITEISLDEFMSQVDTVYKRE